MAQGFTKKPDGWSVGYYPIPFRDGAMVGYRSE